MSSFDISAAFSTRENYDGESPQGLEDCLAAIDEQMWSKGELAHAIASGVIFLCSGIILAVAIFIIDRDCI